MFRAIALEKTDKAEALYAELIGILGEDDPAIVDAEYDIKK